MLPLLKVAACLLALLVCQRAKAGGSPVPDQGAEPGLQGLVAFVQVLPGAGADGRCNLRQTGTPGDGAVVVDATPTSGTNKPTLTNTATFVLDWSHIATPNLAKDSRVMVTVTNSQQNTAEATAKVSAARAVDLKSGHVPHSVLQLSAGGAKVDAVFATTPQAATALLKYVTFSATHDSLAGSSAAVSFELSTDSFQPGFMCRLELTFTVSDPSQPSCDQAGMDTAAFSLLENHTSDMPAHQHFQSTTLGDCIGACAADYACIAFSFEEAPGACTHRHNATANELCNVQPTGSTGTIMGVKPYPYPSPSASAASTSKLAPLTAGLEVWHHDLYELESSDATLCATACEAEPLCQGMSFTGNRCFLKQGLAPPSSTTASGTVRPSNAYQAHVKLTGSRAGVCTIEQGSQGGAGAHMSLGIFDSGTFTFTAFPDGAALTGLSYQEVLPDGSASEPQTLDITPVTVGAKETAFQRQSSALPGGPGTLTLLYQAAGAGESGKAVADTGSQEAAGVLPKALTFKAEAMQLNRRASPVAGTVGYSVVITFTIAVQKTAGSCLLKSTFAVTHPGLGPEIGSQSLKYKLYPYMAAPGNSTDLGYVGTALATTYGDCAMQCMHNHKCRAFTYHKQICVLKNATIGVESLSFMPPGQAPHPWYTGIGVSDSGGFVSQRLDNLLATAHAVFDSLRDAWGAAIGWARR